MVVPFQVLRHGGDRGTLRGEPGLACRVHRCLPPARLCALLQGRSIFGSATQSVNPKRRSTSESIPTTCRGMKLGVPQFHFFRLPFARENHETHKKHETTDGIPGVTPSPTSTDEGLGLPGRSNKMGVGQSFTTRNRTAGVGPCCHLPEQPILGPQVSV